MKGDGCESEIYILKQTNQQAKANRISGPQSLLTERHPNLLAAREVCRCEAPWTFFWMNKRARKLCMTEACGRHGMLWQYKLQRGCPAFHLMPLPANVCGTKAEVTASPTALQFWQPVIFLWIHSLPLCSPGLLLGAFYGTHDALRKKKLNHIAVNFARRISQRPSRSQ